MCDRAIDVIVFKSEWMRPKT